MRRTAAGLLLAALLALSVPPVAADEPEPLSISPEVQAGRLAATGGRVRRDGDRLAFMAASGQVILRDNPRCDEEPDLCARHYLIGFEPRLRGYLVLVTYYEDHDFRLVDIEGGRVTVLGGMPRFSPQGELFAVVGDAECCGISFNGIQIWSSRGPTPVWQYERPAGAPTRYPLFAFKAWDGEDRLLLDVTNVADDGNAVHPGLVERRAGGWTPVLPAVR